MLELENIQMKLDILYDAIGAYVTVFGHAPNLSDVPTREVDALLRMFGDYLVQIRNDVNELMGEKRDDI